MSDDREKTAPGAAAAPCQGGSTTPAPNVAPRARTHDPATLAGALVLGVLFLVVSAIALLGLGLLRVSFAALLWIRGVVSDGLRDFVLVVLMWFAGALSLYMVWALFVGPTVRYLLK